jgi:CheY-like chemotaxis protein
MKTAPHGIGFYLVVLILIAVIPLVISAVVLVARQSELQREAFERSLLQTALALSVAVNRQLNTYQVMLETLAQSEDLDRGRMQPFHEFLSADIDRTRSREVGFDRHLVKPVDPEELLRVLVTD